MELTYHANSIEAQIDEDGRIILPQNLRDKLDLIPDEKARFMGRNDHFQIWKE
jgi:MraZ protein